MAVVDNFINKKHSYELRILQKKRGENVEIWSFSKYVCSEPITDCENFKNYFKYYDICTIFRKNI